MVLRRWPRISFLVSVGISGSLTGSSRVRPGGTLAPRLRVRKDRRGEEPCLFTFEHPVPPLTARRRDVDPGVIAGGGRRQRAASSSRPRARPSRRDAIAGVSTPLLDAGRRARRREHGRVRDNRTCLSSIPEWPPCGGWSSSSLYRHSACWHPQRSSVIWPAPCSVHCNSRPRGHGGTVHLHEGGRISSGPSGQLSCCLVRCHSRLLCQRRTAISRKYPILSAGASVQKGTGRSRYLPGHGACQPAERTTCPSRRPRATSTRTVPPWPGSAIRIPAPTST